MKDKLLYRIPEVAEHLSLSRSKVYELVRAGALPSVRIDGVRRIHGADVVAYVERHSSRQHVVVCHPCDRLQRGEQTSLGRRVLE